MRAAIDFERLWQCVTAHHPGTPYGLHGPVHWRRVERNGLLLATHTGADADIVRLFAVLHDSCRTNDGRDQDHGARAAEYAKTLHGDFFDLTDDEFTLLQYACIWHTEGLHHEDPTIGTCWDADRLDLGRVRIIPSAKFMSTAFGREIADVGSIEPFLEPVT